MATRYTLLKIGRQRSKKNANSDRTQTILIHIQTTTKGRIAVLSIQGISAIFKYLPLYH